MFLGIFSGLELKLGIFVHLKTVIPIYEYGQATSCCGIIKQLLFLTSINTMPGRFYEMCEVLISGEVFSLIFKMLIIVHM